MTVERTNPALVSAIVQDLHPPRCNSATGYGPKLPTAYRVRYAGRWRRVYAICYGNASSVYINVRGAREFLDIATEYALSDGLSDSALGMVDA